NISSGGQVGSWNTSYQSKNEIRKTAAELSVEILVAMREGKGHPRPEGGPIIPTVNEIDPVVVLVAEATAGGISLNWEGVSGRDYLGYNVYRSESAAGPYGFLNDADGTYFSDKTTVPGTTYYYQVGEVDFEGQEHRSKVTGSALALAAPVKSTDQDRLDSPLIYGLSEVVGGASLEFLPALSGENQQLASFRIYRASDKENWGQIGEVQVDRSAAGGEAQLKYTFIDRKLSPGVQRFSYAVTAVTGEGVESQLSDGFDFSPTMVTPVELSRPLVGISASDTLDTTPSEPAPEINAQLEWQADDTDLLDVASPLEEASLNAVDTQPSEPATKINAQIEWQTDDTDLEDVASPLEQASLEAVVADSGEITDVMPPAIGSIQTSSLVIGGLMAADQKLLREGKLLWSPAEAGEGYRVYRRLVGGEWAQLEQIFGLLNTVYADRDGLEDGRDYEYSYSVFDSATESAKSQPVTITMKGVPLAPTGFKAKSGLAKRVELSWDGIDDADIVGYSVYRADFTETNKRFNVEFLEDVAGAQTVTFIDAGSELFPIKDGGRYFYAVAARNTFDAIGKLSPAIRAQTKPSPRRIESINVAQEEGRVVISWSYQSEDVAKFLVSRRVAGQSWQTLGNVDATERRYVDIIPGQAPPADYRIVVMDSTGLTSEPTETN
ncbi:MAG: fibronectin type 3 domain-containing protein, partial [Halieaceae bacterium]